MSYIVFAAIAVVFAVGARWYWQRGAHPMPDCLKPGHPMPLFLAETEDGERIDSGALEGKPAVVLFVRGSWCPFCSAQVKNLTRYYKEIVDLGARLVFVTPKPLDTTRRVADMFGVEFEFWLDTDLEIARTLGLLHKGGVPGGHKAGYGSDTIWPTAVVTDATGTIRFTALSRHIIDRPNPKSLLSALRSAIA